MFHWLFAASFAGAWLTAETERFRLVHASLGYLFAALLGFRLIYGLVGPRRSRLGVLWAKVSGFKQWLGGLKSVRALADVKARQGLNMLMGVVLVAMLALVVPLTLSGHATYEDWGAWLSVGDWMEEIHECFANFFLGLIALHLGLLAILGVLRWENPARPMWTGCIPGAGPSPVQHDRKGLGLILGLSALLLMAWLMS
jgi:cytochrome b